MAKSIKRSERASFLLAVVVRRVLFGLCCWTMSSASAEPPTSPVTTPATWQRFEFAQRQLGTLIKYTVYAPDHSVANQASLAAEQRVLELDAILSHYRADSELSRLCKEYEAENQATVHKSPTAVSLDLWTVLQRADYLSRRSHGAFDMTVGPYTRLWKRAIRQQNLPDPKRLAQVAGLVGHDLVDLDAQQQSVTLLRPGMRLDLSAIAKGYIADQALHVLRTHGLSSALVDAGGDLAIGDPPPGRLGWEIAIAAGEPPEESNSEMAGYSPATKTICVRNCGIATSGDAFQHVEVAGRRYSHVIDPRTGQAVEHQLTVTVAAPDAMTADALASTVSVLGREAGWKFVSGEPNSTALCVSDPAEPSAPRSAPVVGTPPTGFQELTEFRRALVRFGYAPSSR